MKAAKEETKEDTREWMTSQVLASTFRVATLKKSYLIPIKARDIVHRNREASSIHIEAQKTRYQSN